MLITGGAGFIGSNLTNYLIKKFTYNKIVVMDALKYSGILNSISDLISKKQIKFIQADITDSDAAYKIIKENRISNIVHLAAESHVDRSIRSAKPFIDSNIIGTFVMLESFKKYWLECGASSDWRFIHVSTDEVFGSLVPGEAPFDEKTKYSPRSPYSASKAGSDLLAGAWFSTYGLPVIVTNCSNNYGPYQFPEKLIPLTITNAISGKKIPIYGNGKNIRDWLYVEDHCKALEMILKRGKIGESYCLGGDSQLKNIDLVIKICELIDKSNLNLPIRPTRNLIEFVTDRQGHDFRYAIDNSKIKSDLGWKPIININQGLAKTVDWYLSNENWLLSLKN